MFIAHNLSVVRHISSRIGVMYLGSLVELGESYELKPRAIHPYTKTRWSAVPIPDPQVSRAKKRIVLEGDIPSPMNPPNGLPLPHPLPLCKGHLQRKLPYLQEYGKDHFAACHMLEDYKPL